MEAHRISSINYGKLARTLTIELNLPVKDRNSGGAECVKVSRTEIDRLIEQSPAIPKNVLYDYEKQFSGRGLSEPEIIVINKVDIYEDQENKVATTVSEAGLKFKDAILKAKKPLFQITASNSISEKRKEKINNELSEIGSSRMVSSINTNDSIKSTFSNVLSKFSISPKPKPELPQFSETPEIPESISKTFLPPIKTRFFKETQHADIESGPLSVETIKKTTEPEEPEPVIINEEDDIEIGDIVEGLVNSTVETTENVSNELEILRTSKLVSSKK